MSQAKNKLSSSIANVLHLLPFSYSHLLNRYVYSFALFPAATK